MRSSTFALAVLALAAVASVGDARLMGRALASGPDADGDIEPSQLFMIVCLSIGAFVMLVALIACLLVLKRFGGAATSEPTGPAYAGVPGMAAVGSPYAPMFMPQPMYMQQQQMPMQMVPMQMPMQKSAVPMPMPYQQPAQQQQAASAVQPISAMSRARMNADDHNEVADIHGDNNARVQQMVAEAGAGAGADGSSHGFQAHQA